MTYMRRIDRTLKYILNNWQVTYKAPTLLGPLPCKEEMRGTQLIITFTSALGNTSNRQVGDINQDVKDRLSGIQGPVLKIHCGHISKSNNIPQVPQKPSSRTSQLLSACLASFHWPTSPCRPENQ
jgi:hypothetical protein